MRGADISQRQGSPAQAARGQGGTSLIELIVTMAMATVIGGAGVVALANILGFSRNVSSRATAEQQAQLAVNQIQSQVRSGNVLYQPQATSDGWTVLVYTQANREQKCVQWQVVNSAGELRTRSWSPDWNANGVVDNGEVTEWHTVATGVVNNQAGQAPFSVPPDAPYGARLLNIVLVVDAGHGQRQTLTAAATGRNTEYGYDQAICGDQP